MRYRHSNKNLFNAFGFSMIEVMAAIAVLGVVAASVLQMFNFGNYTRSIKEEALVADYLLIRKAEEIKSRPFNTNFNESGTSYGGYSGYYFEVVQTSNYQGNGYLKHVRIIIFWTSQTGAFKTRTLYILLADD